MEVDETATAATSAPSPPKTKRNIGPSPARPRNRLVDARGVSSLFRGRAGLGPMFLFVFGGLGALVAAVAVSSDLRRFIELLAQRVQSLLGL